MSNSRLVNINTFSQLLGKFFSLVFGFLTTLILRRHLGLDDFGNYIFITSYLSLFIAFSDLGTHLVSVNAASQQKTRLAEILGSVFWLRLFISLASIIFSFLVAKLFFPSSLYFLFLFCLPLILLSSVKIFLTVVFHSQLKLYFVSLMDFLIAFFLFIASLIIYFRSLNLKNYIKLMDLSYMAVILILSVIGAKIIKINWQLKLKLIKKLFFKSLPLGMILILYTLYSRLDNFILNNYWGSQAVGIYGLAYKIYENLVLPAAFFMNSLLPILSPKVVFFKNKKSFPLWQKAADLLIAVSIFLVIIFFITAPFIIKIFVGRYSQPESLTIRILLLALPTAFLNHLIGYTIIITKKLKTSLFVSFGALIFNLIFNLILIPKFAYYGAAINVSLTQVFVLVFNLMIIYKENKFRLTFFHWPKTIYFFIKKKGKIFDD